MNTCVYGKRFAERKVFYQTFCYDTFQLLSSAIVGIPFSESGYIKVETFSRVHLVKSRGFLFCFSPTHHPIILPKLRLRAHLPYLLELPLCGPYHMLHPNDPRFFSRQKRGIHYDILDITTR
jgi:hypothetical protein